MNRELKFRAWDKKGKCFVHEDRFAVKMTGEVVDLFFPDNAFDLVIDQFTGLRDKNGKEIYEGDVVELAEPRNSWHPKNQRYEVLWRNPTSYKDGGIYHKGFAGFDLKRLKQPGLSTVFDEDEIEVIGNIHESPHLLNPPS